MKLMPYQSTGVAHLAGFRHALLADEPGLGKTPQAIVAADGVAAKSILVVCPAVAKINWKREFLRWQTVPRSIEVMHGGKAPVPDTDVVVVNYDLLSRGALRVLPGLMKRDWDVLILDEAHALKTRGSNRTRAVYGKKLDTDNGLASCAERVWLLTGTPAPNHAGELWTHFHALWPDLIDLGSGRPLSEFGFQDRYCNVVSNNFGRQIKGTKKAAVMDLKAKLDTVMLRRRKKDVLADLPELIFDTVPLDPADVPPFDRKNFQRAETELGLGPMSDDDLLAHLRSNEVELATERRLTGMVKAPLAVQWIDGELADNYDKMIVLAHHTTVIDLLQKQLAQYNPVVIQGSTPPRTRQKAIDNFQVVPDVRLFIGQIMAVKEAITLTAAKRVVFVEADWSPSNNYQAACRAHRIGQHDNVLAQFLTLDGSIDQQIMEILARKASDFADLFGTP